MQQKEDSEAVRPLDYLFRPRIVAYLRTSRSKVASRPQKRALLRTRVDINENGSLPDCRIFRLVDYRVETSNFSQDLNLLEEFTEEIMRSVLP